jgi:hypothetical protein
MRKISIFSFDRMNSLRNNLMYANKIKFANKKYKERKPKIAKIFEVYKINGS